MSDAGISVGEVIQTLDLIWRITSNLSTAAYKLFHVLYYAKHEGQTSFRRLARSADAIGYLEINTQDEKALQDILQKLESYKVLYSRLPDLNLNDSRTQIAFDHAQAPAVQAILNMYSAEKLERLQKLKSTHKAGSEKYQLEKARIEAAFPAISFITADDYALTRLDQSGKETAEYQKLEESARQNMKQEEKNIAPSSQDEKPLSTEEKIAFVLSAKQLARNEELLASRKAERFSLPTPLIEEPVQIGDSQKSVYRLRYPDGDLSVLIPKSHILDKQHILIEKDRTYQVLSNQALEIRHIKGSMVLAEIQSQLSRKSEKEKNQKLEAPTPGRTTGKTRRKSL